jgi:hypothetical protein
MKVDPEKLSAAITSIEHGLDEYITGLNKTARNDVMQQIEVLGRMFAHDMFIRDKIGNLRNCCRALYSQKDLRKYGTDADGIKARMKAECRIIRTWGSRDRSGN